MQPSTTPQVVLITGGTGAIGREIALRLARRGDCVFITGRDAERGAACVAALQAEAPGASIAFLRADLTLMHSVTAFAEQVRYQFSRLDLLIHCAGATLRERTFTDEGLEAVFALQYYARFLLTLRLLDNLRQSDRATVVNVSGGGTIRLRVNLDSFESGGYYSGFLALMREAVTNDMVTLEQIERYPEVTFYNYSPGYVRTALFDDLTLPTRVFAHLTGGLTALTPVQAADEITALIGSGKPGGLYSRQGKQNAPAPFTADAKNRARLWQITERRIDQVLNR